MGDPAENEHLSRSFFMQKSHTGQLVFKKRFLRPLQLGRSKCLSHLQIRGFKTWLTDYFSSLHGVNNVDRQKYLIKVIVGEDEFTTTIEPFVFLYSQWPDTINHIKNVIFHVVKSKSNVFFNYIDNGGLLYFKILSPKIQIMFGEALCTFFSFESGQWYNHASTKNIFFFKNSFQNYKADHIGISVNFAAGQSLENNSEIIGIMGTEQIGYFESFDVAVISKPEMLHIRTEVLNELEIRFVNLATGAVFSSIHPPNFPEEIYVSLCFANII